MDMEKIDSAVFREALKDLKDPDQINKIKEREEIRARQIARILKIDEFDGRLKALEQRTQKTTPKQFVKKLLKIYEFPKLQKELLKVLSDIKPHDTKLLKDEVGTGNLPSLKKATEDTIEGCKLSRALVIKSFRGEGVSASTYYYQLEVHPEFQPISV